VGVVYQGLEDSRKRDARIFKLRDIYEQMECVKKTLEWENFDYSLLGKMKPCSDEIFELAKKPSFMKK
jgi:hypothetical protein